MSDDAANTNNEKEEFLRKLKDKINKYTEFVCEYHEGRDYIWVGTHDGLIGTDECHYEILFKGDTLYVEAHFEDDNFKDFHDIELPEKTKEKLEYKKDLKKKQGKIVYANDTGIANTGDTESKIKEVMDKLGKLDELIGAELKRIVCAQRNYVQLKVNDNLYKYIVNTKPLLPSLFLGLSIICMIVSFLGIVIKREICEWQTILAFMSLLVFILSFFVRLRTDNPKWIKLVLKSSLLDSMNGKKLTKENCKILMDIMEL